jgi:hypothetical protein
MTSARLGQDLRIFDRVCGRRTLADLHVEHALAFRKMGTFVLRA